jgi:RNA polymerase sigma-70 factor (ECF subfamily)
MRAEAVPVDPAALTRAAGRSDEEIVAQVLAGEAKLFEVLMRRHNQRLYRVARAILRQEDEIEDVLQDAYLSAYRSLGAFEGRARFATWLVRIAAHHALDRRRRRARLVAFDPEGPEGRLAGSDPGDPEQQRTAREVAQLLERAIDALPQRYRVVYVLRQVQGLEPDEVADCLGIGKGTVKTRLHRARALLRAALDRDPDPVADRVFPFGGERCDRLVGVILRRIAPVLA